MFITAEFSVKFVKWQTVCYSPRFPRFPKVNMYNKSSNPWADFFGKNFQKKSVEKSKNRQKKSSFSPTEKDLILKKFEKYEFTFDKRLTINPNIFTLFLVAVERANQIKFWENFSMKNLVKNRRNFSRRPFRREKTKSDLANSSSRIGTSWRWDFGNLIFSPKSKK